LRNKAIKDYLDSQTSKPEVEKGESLTTVKAAGQLLIYTINLEHH
jgi:hypothetical protein